VVVVVMMVAEVVVFVLGRGMMILEGAMWEKKNPTAQPATTTATATAPCMTTTTYCDEAAMIEQCEGVVKHNWCLECGQSEGMVGWSQTAPDVCRWLFWACQARGGHDPTRSVAWAVGWFWGWDGLGRRASH
jgi:hypothetical protein